MLIGKIWNVQYIFFTKSLTGIFFLLWRKPWSEREMAGYEERDKMAVLRVSKEEI